MRHDYSYSQSIGQAGCQGSIATFCMPDFDAVGIGCHGDDPDQQSCGDSCLSMMEETPCTQYTLLGSQMDDALSPCSYYRDWSCDSVLDSIEQCDSSTYGEQESLEQDL